MNRYCIDAAITETAGDPGTISTTDGEQPAPALDLIYQDHIDFRAADDAAAIDFAEQVQRRHDAAYLMCCGSRPPSGWPCAPRYADCVFRIDEAGELVAVAT